MAKLTKQSVSMKMPPEVLKWLDKYRSTTPKTKFLKLVLEQLTVEYTKDGQPRPKIKRGK